MKIVAHGVAEEINRKSSDTSIRLGAFGARVVEGHRGPDSQRVELTMALTLKTLVSDELKIGETLYITISTERPEEL
jgi:hypothetical protein